MQSSAPGKVVLTGGTGFLGQSLGKRLVELGFQVYVVTRNVQQARKHLSYPARLVSWDNMDGLRQALQRAQAVIHLAGDSIGQFRWTAKTKAKILHSRVVNTQFLVKVIQALEHKPQAFLVASAIGLYGHRPDEVLNETSAPGNGFLAETAKAWEAASLDLPPDVRRVVMRFGVVLGLGGGMLGRLQALYASNLGARLGSGQSNISWIHLDDAIAAIVFLLKNQSLSGVFHLTAPQAIPFLKLHQWLDRRFASLPVPAVPGFVIKLLMGEASSLIFDSVQAVPDALLKAGFEFQHPHLVPALCDIYRDCVLKSPLLQIDEQWVPRSLDEVWDFFSEPKNLESLTPAHLGFQILEVPSGSLKQGSLIQYKISLRGLVLRWLTLISSWQPGQAFADIQIKGPYQAWVHQHSFSELGQGVLIRDFVQFQLPLARFTHPLFGWFLRREVQGIFDYRRQAIYQQWEHKGE